MAPAAGYSQSVGLGGLNVQIDWSAKQAVIFDFDGTIADSLPLHERAYLEVIRSDAPDLGCRFDYERFIGMETSAVFRSLGCDGVRAGELAAKKRDRYGELVDAGQLHFMPGADAFLNALPSMAFRKFIGTSGSPRSISRALKALDIAPQFEQVLTSSDVEAGKPAPDIYLAVVARFGLDPISCAVVEDSANGVAAARAAGIHVIGVYNRQIAELVDLYVEKLADLIGVFAPGNPDTGDGRCASRLS